MKGTIADSLKPTFENVTREFISNSMYEILFSDKIANFKFDFRQEEAIVFIEKTLQDYTNYYEYYYEEADKILDSIKNKNNGNELQAVMVINNYKEFFESLRQIYEVVIDLFFERTGYSGFHVYEMENFFKYIWLRATPEDFNNPEIFLKKQYKMIKDTTLKKYDNEQCLGILNFLDDNILCVKNGIARKWDEADRQMEFRIYDKNHYNNNELYVKPHYLLPLIRYGIYEKNGKKVCHIGSIQNDVYAYTGNTLDKKVNRKKYKVNDGVPEEQKESVDPKNIIALSLFINILHKENITDIEIPSMYVLDYEYHQKRRLDLLEKFENKWSSEEKKIKNPLEYEHDLKVIKNNDENLISEIKSERLIKCFERLLHHYPNGSIKSFSTDLDNVLHISIPVCKSKNDIKGSVLQEMYGLVDKYCDLER